MAAGQAAGGKMFKLLFDDDGISGPFWSSKTLRGGKYVLGTLFVDCGNSLSRAGGIYLLPANGGLTVGLRMLGCG